jgi:phosphonate transport system permease protein
MALATADAPPRLSPPWTATKVALLAIAVAGAAAVYWAWGHIGMSLTVVLDGLEDIRNLLDRMLPPRFVDTGDILGLTVQTFFMAYIATVLASVLSTPLAFMAARNTTPHRMVRPLARAVISLCRAVPDLVFALIFVRAVGLGPLAGILALALHSVGMVGKLYADAIEQIDETPRAAVLSTGASPRQVLVTSVVPQVLPSFLGTSLYRLDINVRTSIILGFVGAGGIGQELQTMLSQLVYDRAMAIVVVIGVLVLLIELVSTALRRAIFGSGALVPPAAPLVALAVLAVAFWSVEINPVELVSGLPDIWSTSLRLFPPDFTTARPEIQEAVVETVAIALVATAIGTILTVPFAFLSARNVAPNRVVHFVARGWILVVRCIPELVLALVFVAAIGLGPVPGVFALSLATVGFLSKLIADGLEEVDPSPREAVAATGAGRLQETATSVVPQAVPALVGSVLYMLDVNIRLSTILGIVGAGGIGFLLGESVRTLHLETTGAILVAVFVIVYAIELLGGWIRRRII